MPGYLDRDGNGGKGGVPVEEIPEIKLPLVCVWYTSEVNTTEWATL